MAVSLSINIIKLSKQNALVKKMIASETIGCINVICSDKTGTLTENKMTVRAFYDTAVHEDISEPASPALLHNICLNTMAELGEDGGFLGNPSECAMLAFYNSAQARNFGGRTYSQERSAHKILSAFPFSSELKHMTTICELDGKPVVYVKGSPECVLAMCTLDGDKQRNVEEQMRRFEARAMRVIAFAHKDLPRLENYEAETAHRALESGLTFDGFVAISDPLRGEVYDAVRSCREAGVALKILTGDNIVTAAAIANELHLLDGGACAVEAAEIAEMSDVELSERLPKISVIARSTPATKMRVVNLLKAQGNTVAMTGDGINDAPALTLGLEPNYADLMKRKPTSRNESIITKPMLLRIAVTGLYMSAVFLGQYVFNFLGVPEPQMSTALFTLFVLFQLFNSFNCRELHRESIFTHLLKNKLMLSVVGCTFVLQVLIIQFAGAFFGTVPLDLALWLKLFAVASSVVIFSELIKWIGRMVW